MTDTTPARMPFFHVKHNDPIPSDEGIYEIARDYPELPSHFYSKLLDRGHATCVNRLAQLAYQKRLNVHKPFIDPREKVSKHDSFSLKEHGYRDTKGREHRVGESIVKASTHIGVLENPDFEYITWRQMLALPSMPREILRLIDAGKNPHLIPLTKGHVNPDGAPARIFHKPTNRHLNVIDEYDRDTEPLTTTKERRNIQEKYQYYREFFDNKLFTSHYGFQNCVLRIVTVSPARKRAMMRLYEDSYGRCKHILFASFETDPFYARSYPKADGRFFTAAYDRVGYEPMRLEHSWE